MIKLVALDVDGTLTDGGVYLDGAGGEFKRFDIQDGMGLVLLRRAGIPVAVISGRFSRATEGRARELGIEFLHNGVGEKLPVLKKLAADLGLKPEEVAFVGDDVNDLDCLRWAGLGISVANGRPEVREAADHVTQASGGYGAVREAAELVLALNSEAERDGT
jgi:3-deoxy-D-manno-octulosonate 8-phosphate phosphatase (KDO 8-P phosphatase)